MLVRPLFQDCRMMSLGSERAWEGARMMSSHIIKRRSLPPDLRKMGTAWSTQYWSRSLKPRFVSAANHLVMKVENLKQLSCTSSPPTWKKSSSKTEESSL